MHKVYTTHKTNRRSNGSFHMLARQQHIRIALLLANTTDCDALSKMLSQNERIEILTVGADVDFGLAKCQRLRPQILVLDPKVSADSLRCAKEMVNEHQIQHLLVLDDRLYAGRLATLLAMPSVSYLTRQAGGAALENAILKIATTGQRAFEPAVEQRLQQTRSGLKLKKMPGQPSVLDLTTRELEVMEILASGYSVRDCAEHLSIAESTIDNHKSRLMKKLGIHKTVEMTHIAIREGLIVV